MVPLTEICYRSNCEFQLQYPHYVDNSKIPKSDTRINWKLEEIKHRRGNLCWRCEKFLTPADLDHSFCNPCWDHSMEHYYEPDPDESCGQDTCLYCGEVREYKYHLEPEPYVPDYMDEP